MEFRTFELDGPVEVRPRKIEDERGYFAEIFRMSAFTERAGRVDFVQDNQSLSVRPGTIRGLHFQSHPAAQGKLVRCLAGRLLDVAVDIRTGSPMYGRRILSGRSRPSFATNLGAGRVCARFLHARAEQRHQLPRDQLLQP